jgi:hypothetical protein
MKAIANRHNTKSQYRKNLSAGSSYCCRKMLVPDT